MAIHLNSDFKDFLKLLNSHKVKYLLIGGHAVGIFGYPRATGDMDIWIDSSRENATRVVTVVKQFGFNLPDVKTETFMTPHRIIRMGLPPFRIEVLTSISGVEFDECFNNKVIIDIDGIPINVINLENLLQNKRAAGRYKDLDDLEKLTKQADN